MQGLVWVLNMYLSGECSNYRWAHDNEAPSLPQLVKALKMLATSSQAAAQVTVVHAFHDSQIKHVLWCCRIVLNVALCRVCSPDWMTRRC